MKCDISFVKCLEKRKDYFSHFLSFIEASRRKGSDEEIVEYLSNCSASLCYRLLSQIFERFYSAKNVLEKERTENLTNDSTYLSRI